MGVTKRTRHLTACRRAQSLHVALVLVGVRRVTVVHIVHIDYEDVLVVMYFA